MKRTFVCLVPALTFTTVRAFAEEPRHVASTERPPDAGPALALSADARATPLDADSDDATGAETKIGLTFGTTFASAYNFRGLNIYKAQKQLDPSLQVAPWISYVVPETSLTITYASSYQAAGEAAAQNRAAGVSHEEDVVVGYRLELPEDVTVTPAFTTYVYPFAEQNAAGTAVPVYIEPSVDVLWANGVVDVDLQATYFHGVQSALADYRYGYLHAQLARSVVIVAPVGFEAVLGYGRKLYVHDLTDNRDDVSLRFGLPVAAAEGIVKPAVNWAWTNLAGQRLSQAYFIFGSLDLSYAL